MKLPDFVRASQSNRPWLRKIIPGLLILGCAGLLSVAIFATGPNATPEERKEKAVPVSTETVKLAEHSPMFSSYGRIEPRQVATLSVDSVGRIQRVHVREGEVVERGAVLLELDDQELRLRLAERRAELLQAEAALRSIDSEYSMAKRTVVQYESMNRVALAKLDRQQDLFRQELISEAQLDEVVQITSQKTIDHERQLREVNDFPNRIAEQQAQIDRMTALVSRAELDLSRARLVAPFTGAVTEVLAAVGVFTQRGQVLVTLADAKDFEIRAAIDDVYGSRLRAALNRGEPIVAVALLEGRKVEVPLERLASSVREGQSGLDAFFSAPSELPLESGRVLEVMVQLPPERKTVALPVQALYENNRVYSVDEGRLRALEVERVGEVVDEHGEYRLLVRSPEFVNGQAVLTTQLPRAISGLLVDPG